MIEDRDDDEDSQSTVQDQKIAGKKNYNWHIDTAIAIDTLTGSQDVHAGSCGKWG